MASQKIQMVLDVDRPGSVKKHGPLVRGAKTAVLREHELLAALEKRGLVTLSDLLDGKVVQKGRIDVDEIYHLGRYVGLSSQKHGDLSPKDVWVRPSTLIRRPDDNKILWFTPSQLAAFYRKEAQTIRLWLRDGFFQEQGCRVKQDPTHHWRIGIPSEHADYPEFLAFSQLKR